MTTKDAFHRVRRADIVFDPDADVASAGWWDDGHNESLLSNNEALAAETPDHADAEYGAAKAGLSILAPIMYFAVGALSAGVLWSAGSLFSGLPSWSRHGDGASPASDTLVLPTIVTDPGEGVLGQGASAGETRAAPSSTEPRTLSAPGSLRIM